MTDAPFTRFDWAIVRPRGAGRLIARQRLAAIRLASGHVHPFTEAICRAFDVPVWLVAGTRPTSRFAYRRKRRQGHSMAVSMATRAITHEATRFEDEAEHRPGPTPGSGG